MIVGQEFISDTTSVCRRTEKARGSPSSCTTVKTSCQKSNVYFPCNACYSPHYYPIARQPRYFFIKSSTALVIATMPVRIVGSGTGANLLECRLGSGAPPGFFDSAIFSGATAPTWKSTAGME